MICLTNLFFRNAKGRSAPLASSRDEKQKPSWMHDQDVVDNSLYTVDPYDDRGPYDSDFRPGPSRPPPKPYDDPYKDVDVTAFLNSIETSSSIPHPTSDHSRSYKESSQFGPRHAYGRSDGRMRGKSRDRGRPYRGRGRGRPTNHERYTAHTQEEPWNSQHDQSFNTHPFPIQNSTQATWQDLSPLPYSSNSHHPEDYRQEQMFDAHPQTEGVLYNQNYSNGFLDQNHETFSTPSSSFQPNLPYQPYIQPHINPRFAAYFGLNLNFTGTHQQHPVPQANGFTSPPIAYQQSTYSREQGYDEHSSDMSKHNLPVHMSYPY